MATHCAQRLCRGALVAALLLLAACAESQPDPEPEPEPEPEPRTVLSIESPADGAVLSSGLVVVSGAVDPPEAVAVSGVPAELDTGRFRAVLDLEEGAHELRAVGLATGTVASVGVVIDRTPPLLTLVQPARGSVWPDAEEGPQLEVLLATPDDVAELSVDGEPWDAPSSSEELRLQLPGGEGVRLVTVEASDPAGNLGQEHCAFLAGAVREPAPEEQAISALHLGPAGLAEVATIINRFYTSVSLGDYLDEDAPLYESPYLVLRLTGVAYARQPAFELRASDAGLQVDIDIRDLDLELSLCTDPSSGEEHPIGLRAKRVSASGLLNIDPGPEGVTVTLDAPPPSIEQLQVYGYVEGLFEPRAPLHEAFQELAPELLHMLLEDLLPGYLEDLFDELLEPWSVPLEDTTLSIQPTVYELEASDAGVDLTLGLALDLPPEAALPGRTGMALLSGGPPPSLAERDGIALALGQDMLNLLFYRLWQIGFLDLVVDQALLDDAEAEISLVAGLLGTVASAQSVHPETPIELRLAPALWPYARFEEDRLALTVGALALEGRTVGADVRTLLSCSVSLEAAVGMRVLPSDQTLQVGFDRLDLYLDVLDPELKVLGEREYEPIARTLLQGLDPALTVLLGSVLLPTLEGFGLERLELEADDSGRYLVVEALVNEVKP